MTGELLGPRMALRSGHTPPGLRVGALKQFVPPFDFGGLDVPRHGNAGDEAPAIKDDAERSRRTLPIQANELWAPA